MGNIAGDLKFISFVVISSVLVVAWLSPTTKKGKEKLRRLRIGELFRQTLWSPISFKYRKSATG
jgi:hypothetical protein